MLFRKLRPARNEFRKLSPIRNKRGTLLISGMLNAGSCHQMPAFNLASFVVDVRKVYENKRGGDTLKPVHS